MELEEPTTPFDPPVDARPLMPEPPPVRLVAITDVTLDASTGSEAELDAFYVEVLRFQRDQDVPAIVYRAENLAIVFRQVEGLVRRDDFQHTELLVPSLGSLRFELKERNIAYDQQQALYPGQDAIVLQDPAGNWLRISEFNRIL